MRVLAVLAAVLVAAFVVVPPVLAGGPGTGSFPAAFEEYRNSGRREFPPALQDVVDYWFRFHVVKGLLAVALLGVLIALGLALWRRYLATGRFAVAGTAVAALGALALAAVMANVQGAVAPFAALLPLLPADVGRRSAAALRSGDRTASLDVVISDYTRYHAVMAVVATFVALASIAAAVVLARRSAAARDRRARRVLGAFGGVAALLAVVSLVLVVANTTTTLDPEPGLLGFFNGGW